MTSKFLSLLVALIALSPGVVWAYHFQPRTVSTIVDNTSGSDVGQYLAFQLLKLSLDKNNISYDFGVNGLNKTFSAPFSSVPHFVINNNHVTLGGADYGVVLWPRDNADYGDVTCDYSIMLRLTQVRPDGDTGLFSFYVYADYGVVRCQNWFNSSFSGSLADRTLSLLPNVSNTMPHLVTDTSISYMANKNRVYNIYQSGGGSNVAGVFYYGSLSEYMNSLSDILITYGGSTNLTWANNFTYSIRDVSRQLLQSDLPWQLQQYNRDYNNAEHTQVYFIHADTDGGTEPDVSEYYTGHDYLDPVDDWGQPADIGGGSGVGGEVTGFSQGAQGQMTGSAESALENYFGDPTDTTLDVTPPTGEEELEERDDIELDSTFLTQVQSSLTSELPHGITSLQQIVTALKTPDSRNIPVITLPLTINIRGFHNGQLFDFANKPQINFAFLKEDPYKIYYENARIIAVIFLSACLCIYILKDLFMLSNKGSD